MVRPAQFDYWTPDKLDATFPTIHALASQIGRINQSSTFRLLNSSYFRIKNVELAYSLNFKKSSLGINRLKVSLSGYNLFTITDIQVGDPELNAPNNYPVMKRYTLGIQLDF